jgi:hypothetical protein
MSLPRAIQEQADRADAIHRQLYGNTEAPQVPAAEAPVVAPVEPTPQPQAMPEAVTPPTEQPVTADSPWEKKYQVLAGKYAAEVPRLAQEIRDLKAQLQAKERTPAKEIIPAGKFTAEQVIETYGDDYAAAVAAVADERVSRVREDLEARFDQLASATAATARETFMRAIAQEVPDWQVIDNDPRFTQFLDEIEPMSGQPRRYFFAEADKRNDAERITFFFKSFKTATNPAPAPAAQIPGRMGVEYQLAPASSRAAEAPPGKRIWTQIDVRKFYQDVQRGRINEVDAQRIESDIFAAQAEGRFLAG